MASRSHPVMTQEEYELINELLEERFGLAFPETKREILESRLRPRLTVHRLRTFMDYYMLLFCQPDTGIEIRELAQAVTNNETYFFRETHQFNALFDAGLDQLKAEPAAPDALRFLIAGCSSGEEVYTFNFFLKENQYRLWGHRVDVDAFDLDETRVQMGLRAVYEGGSLRAIDSEQLRRYFVPNGSPGTYEVKPMFRSGVNLRTGNILQLSSFYRGLPYDAIFCRNVLIYFTEKMLRQAIQNFATTLRRGGLLFLGHSESIIGVSRRFEPIRLGTVIVYRRL